MAKQISSWIVKHPFLILTVTVLMVTASLLGMPPRVNSDFEVYFGPANANLSSYRQMQNDYATTDNVLFVVAPESGDVFTNRTLRIVSELTEQGWLLPYATRVDSITNFQHTEARDDELMVNDLVEDPAKASAADLEKARQVALNEPQLINRLIPPDSRVTGVNVNFTLPGKDKTREIPEVVAAVRELIRAFESRYPDIRIYTTGRIVNNNAFRDASIYDVTHIVPLAFTIAMVLIAFYLFIASRSVSTMILGTIATLMVVVASIAATMGIAAWMDIEISPPVANAPTMILTLAIADCIHILVTYFQQMRLGNNRRNAMAESLRLNQQPIFLTSITTMVGFLSLNFSDSPPFQDLGNVVAMGVMIAWLFAVTLLPAITVLFPLRVRTTKTAEQSGNRLADFVIRRRYSLFTLMLIAIVATSAFLPTNKLNDVWAEYFDESMEVRANSDFIREHLTSPNSIEFSLASGEQNGIADPEYLKTVAAFSDWLESQPDILHVSTFTDVMKRLNKSMHNDDPAYYKLPDDRELAAQYILLYELSLPFGLDLTNQLTMNKDATRVIGTIKGSSTATVLELQEQAQAWLKANAPDTMYHAGTSTDVMFAHIGYSNVRSMLKGTFIALVIISVILGFALRSAKFGVISLIPNIVPATVAFGLWGMIDGEIGIGLSVVAGMTLGIVVDYTVHFLSKYLRAQREYGLNEPESIRYAFSTVGTALMVTTLILVANFGVLAFSDFALNGDMGLLTAITIVVALLVDFFFLPPLLLFLTRPKGKAGQVTKPGSPDIRTAGNLSSQSEADSSGQGAMPSASS
ncbi:MAG: MMPL family transporter [Ketobacteraceae bacterium]|nr:MMPL family transporter [Ketobacteraceae bacterium]